MTADIKINKVLLPLSWLYGLGVWFRNKLFDCGLFSGEEFSVPVISVGNIAVGGTGKTPHTEYLIRLLSPKIKIAVLSRGYRRKTSGFVLADENSDSSTIGDEPFQIYRKFPEILVAVDANRRRGITNLLALPQDKRPDVILLDDAFQHRYVKPSLSILLIDSNRLLYEDKLLPAGRLREPAKNKSRAEIIIVTKCPEEFKPIDYRVIGKNLDLYPYQSLFFTSFRYGGLTPVFSYGRVNNNPKSLDDIKLRTISVLLLAGIASPQGLIKELNKYSKHVDTLIYPDHHAFSNGDLTEIKQKFDALSGENKIIITTEKDAVRLMDCPNISESVKKALYYLPVEVIFKQEQEYMFKQKIENHVGNIKTNGIMA
ncbi:tetraacyldisaccharide 4'-kinase [Bacteroidia bacterium]|nr:tetraacyldisaccharide 4'-kinase [Bacteroidia bacterium]GHU89085.1 tetraacyldisaccharide 4'-kinase [Bacteroidia bacterium]